MQRVDAVVVGAGAVGASTAWWLARRGRHVVVVEQFDRGHARGSSHGATRIFRFAYPDPTYVRLAQAALPLWRELEAEAGRTLLEVTGAVDHGDLAAIEATAEALRACGARHEVLTPAAAAERWPHMRT
ncbi:MAG: FAD-dependent oxidoreductase, partial [Acidimicrobiia bacterium]|nr:FAD-dependent oxidoreductase [Acidimicrobiia bacterium]